MEEYEVHIQDLKNTSYCGENIAMTFAFVNIDHAIQNARNKGRLLPCKNCVDAIYEIIKR